MKVVDLGSKTGGSLDVFRSEGQRYLNKFAKGIVPEQCLATDKTDKYKAEVEAKGYNFMQIDLRDTAEVLAKLPEADFYLAWDLLEHLPNKEAADIVVQWMLRKARKAIWLRMPSFEPDEHNGEGVLKMYGMRFCWTTWKGHPTHYRLSDALAAIGTWRHNPKPHGLYSILVSPGWNGLYTDTTHEKIVPIDAANEASSYDASTMAPKEKLSFEPPLVAQWDVLAIRP